MSIGTRIRALRTARKLTMDELAAALNIKTSNISRYENDKYLPSADTIVALSQIFNVTTDWLLKGEDPTFSLKHFVSETNLLESFRKLTEIQKERTLERIEVYLEELRYKRDDIGQATTINKNNDYPTYNVSSLFKTELWGDISAGGGIDAIVNKEIIDSPVKCDFALRVRGDSMEPIFKNNSIIFLVHECELQYNGEIAAIQIDDGIPASFLKKVYIDNEEKTIRLVSINPLYDDITLPANHVRILGKVIYPRS